MVSLSRVLIGVVVVLVVLAASQHSALRLWQSEAVVRPATVVAPACVGDKTCSPAPGRAATSSNNAGSRVRGVKPSTSALSSSSSSRPQSSTATWAEIKYDAFLQSPNADGQVWELPDSSDLGVRAATKSLAAIVAEYRSCRGTGNILGVPNATDVRIAAATTPLWRATDRDIDQICKKRNTVRIRDETHVPLIVYGALFGFEADMLEIVFHETLPVVDALIIAESAGTHAKLKKPLLFHRLMRSRLRRFAHLVANERQPAAPPPSQASSAGAAAAATASADRPKIYRAVHELRRRASSGWAVERRQRRAFQLALPKVLAQLRQLPGNGDGNRPVIVVSQLDLDEIPTRETLLYWKHCETPKQLPLRVVWFRYQLECQQQKNHTYFTTTIWRLPRLRDPLPLDLDLYAMRRDLLPIEPAKDARGDDNSSTAIANEICRSVQFGLDNVAWHFSAFGGVASVKRKNRHTPHSYVRRSMMTMIAEQIRGCVYWAESRWRLPVEWWTCRAAAPADEARRTRVMPVALPHFVSENICMFTRMGWLT